MIGPLRPTDPTAVGGFTLTGRLGEGAQGTVFLGASGTGERVAVKVLHAQVSQDPEQLRRFQRELAAVQRVAPFCTARILAFDAAADRPYIVSEYIEGPSLQQLISEGRTFAGTDLERLAIATATALAAVHEAGVVHRDFKPDNVLLGQGGPRVIDFGIARPLDAATATGGVIGTPSYMAPEQLAGAPARPPLDLFAWACTMAAAANGRPPFGNDNIPAVITRIVNDRPELGRIEGGLRDLVAACLEKDPQRRPTAQQALLRLLGGGHGGEQRRDLLASGASEAAELSPPSPPPSAPFSAPGSAPTPPHAFSPAYLPPAPPPGYAPVHAPPAGPTHPGSVRHQRSGRARSTVIAVATVAALLLAGVGTAVLLSNRESGTGTASSGTASSGTGSSPQAGSGAGSCTYLPQTGGAASTLREAGTPPPRPEFTGTVRANLTTDRGDIGIDLDAAKAPCAVNSFAYLAKRGFYNYTACHRLTTAAALRVLQCGDPSGTGSGGPTYRFGSENPGAKYPRGTVALANTGQPDTNGSQFFIVYRDVRELPDGYTVFGKVVSGLDVIDDVAERGSDNSVGPGDGRPRRGIAVQRVTLTPQP